jgi:hypothetical protein
MNIIRTCAILLACVLLCLSCTRSTMPEQDYDNPSILNLPATTTTMLMDSFKEAFSSRDIIAYEALLDDRYLFFFSAPGETWNKEEDLISTTTMFSGESCLNSKGAIAPGISSIIVDKFILLESWEPVAANHQHFGDIPGVIKALYEVRIVLHHSQGTITIDSDQIFYAIPVLADDGITWKLIGQEDIE